MTEAAVMPVDLGHALNTVLRGYLEGARAALETLPGGPRGYQLLSIAGAADCSNQAGIAKDMGLDRTVMTHLIDELESAGLVQRQPDPADRRARRVLVTPAGTAAHAAAVDAIRSVEQGVLAALSEPEADQFRALLHKLVAGAPVGSSDDPCSIVDACSGAEPCGG